MKGKYYQGSLAKDNRVGVLTLQNIKTYHKESYTTEVSYYWASNFIH